MSRHSRFLRDPHWITVQYSGTCAACKARIAKGTRAWYYPSSREMFGQDCCGAGMARAALATLKSPMNTPKPRKALK